ncbi:S8 family serine peptidase [Actinosynnema sp. NPDC020468]|uniref:S8 family serine peptidase n=1 Tax=Actinosynnema sp. NPDC020468 TaxID=3154488 RepID=UPI0033E47577
MRSPRGLSRRRTPLVVAGAAVLLTVLGTVTPATADPAKATKGIDARTAAQIAALQNIKKSLSPTESKVDSALVIEQRRRADVGTFAKLPSLRTGVKVQAGNTVLVDIRSDKVTDGLVGAVRTAGGAIRSVSTEGGTVRAQVPLAALNGLAGRSDVRRVEVAAEAKTFHETSPGSRVTPSATKPSKEDKAREVESRTRSALAAPLAAKVAEADRAHAADTARQITRVTGTGVKLCAISDGVTSLAASQASGELPAVDVLPGQEGSGDEGTAMLEILHDLAPNAALGFATAYNGDASFADNIRKLRSDLRCDVIVDDILYFNESPFQDGIIARAVDAVVADGAVYFSSAGNEGNVADGTAGHWEGNFTDSGVGVGKFAGTAHDFNPSPTAKQVFDPLSASSGNVPVTLFWADPLGRSANDYDLYLANAQGNVVASAQNIQDGTQDPYERLNTPAGTGGGLRLAVVKFRGDDRYLALTALGGRFKDSSDGLKAYATSGVTRGHSAAKGAISVAAAPANGPLPFDLEPGDPANPRGPYPGVFERTQKPERFTSDGPRRTFFAPDGSPREEVRQKPEITAADGVVTSAPGFNPFFGTSASAPSAAGVAGLILSGNPGLTPAEVRDALTSTALDLVEPGVDNRTGAGVVRADLALAYTGASPQPLARAQKPTIVNDNDGSQYLKPGTTATVTVPVLNSGDGTAASTSLVLTTTAAGVVVAPRSKYYGNIEAGQTGVNTFKVTVPASTPVGAAVRLDAKVTYAGATSPTTTALNLAVGEPAKEAKNFAYSGPVVAIPDNDSTGVTVQIPVSGVGRGSKLTFSVDGDPCSATDGATTVGIDHTFVGDLVGTLTSPSGRSVTVFQKSGGTGANLCKVVFDDAADRAFSTVTSAQAPFTGSWRPTGSLAGFLADPVDGTWTFKVVDTAASDRGSVRAVSLHINGYV